MAPAANALTIMGAWSNARPSSSVLPTFPPELPLRDVPPTETPGVARFRDLMGRFATGVCVVAVPGREGAVSGMTVNSLVSVSLDPMLIAWSLQNGSSQFDRFSTSERFTVSILSEAQSDIAQRYASRADSGLCRDDFGGSYGGLPVIAGGLGYLECTSWSTYRAGDHTMIFGEVTALDMPEEDSAPLCFFDGRFRHIAS